MEILISWHANTKTKVLIEDECENGYLLKLHGESSQINQVYSYDIIEELKEDIIYWNFRMIYIDKSIIPALIEECEESEECEEIEYKKKYYTNLKEYLEGIKE